MGGRLLAGSIVGIGAALGLVGHRLRDLGARGDEAARALPGDGLVPAAHARSTMATTLRASPEDVFSWLVQMGHGRAGWYSFDRLDNGGVPSADRIVPAWQTLAVGDRMPARPGGKAWFEVVELEPARTLVLRATLTVPGGRSTDRARGLPHRYCDSTWAFVLEPAEGGGTRLLVRLRVAGAPRLALALGAALVLLPGHVVMQRRQLVQLRRRVAGRPGR